MGPFLSIKNSWCSYNNVWFHLLIVSRNQKLFRRLCLNPSIDQSFKSIQRQTFTPSSPLSMVYRSQFIQYPFGIHRLPSWLNNNTNNNSAYLPPPSLSPWHVPLLWVEKVQKVSRQQSLADPWLRLLRLQVWLLPEQDRSQVRAMSTESGCPVQPHHDLHGPELGDSVLELSGGLSPEAPPTPSPYRWRVLWRTNGSGGSVVLWHAVQDQVQQVLGECGLYAVLWVHQRDQVDDDQLGGLYHVLCPGART